MEGTGASPHGLRELSLNLRYIFSRLYFLDAVNALVAASASRATGENAPLAIVCRATPT